MFEAAMDSSFLGGGGHIGPPFGVVVDSTSCISLRTITAATDEGTPDPPAI